MVGTVSIGSLAATFFITAVDSASYKMANRVIPYAPQSLDELRARVDYYVSRVARAAAELARAEAECVSTTLADMPRDVLMLIWQRLGAAEVSAARRSCRRLATIFLHRQIRVTKRNLAEVSPRYLTPNATIKITVQSLTPQGVCILAAFGYNRPIHVTEGNNHRQRTVFQPLQVRELNIGKGVSWHSISDAFDDQTVQSLTMFVHDGELAGSPQPFPNLRRLHLQEYTFFRTRVPVRYNELTITLATFIKVTEQLTFEHTRFIVTDMHLIPKYMILVQWSNCLVKFPELKPSDVDNICLTSWHGMGSRNLIPIGDGWYKDAMD